MSKSSSKPIGERWINIANLVLTAITGIVITLYLNHRENKLSIELAERNEAFQSEIVNLQNEVQRKSSLAQLKITSSCARYTTYCDPIVSVTNSGDAAAQQVKVVTYVHYIYPEWAESIFDIAQFPIKESDPSIHSTIIYTNVRALASTSLPKNNAVEFLIETLPSNSSQFYVFGLPQTDLSLVSNSFTQTATIIYPGQLESDWRYYVENDLEGSMRWRFPVANFVVNATCLNCEGKIEETRFLVSSLTNWGLNLLQTVPDDKNPKDILELRLDSLLSADISFTPPITVPICYELIYAAGNEWRLRPSAFGC